MIIFTEKAKLDIYKSKDYYKDIDIVLVKRFTLEIEKSIKLIEKFPDFGSVRYSDYSEDFILRFCILKSFPYMIFYKVEDDNIFIIRVLHMSMDISHHLYF